MTPGFYGKMPRHGDFLRRGLPVDMVTAWDAWVSAGIEAARAQLGEADFAGAWAAMPCWCLSLPAGACGAAPISGVIAASRDAVGRRFPLLIAALIPAPDDAWFATLTARALEAAQGHWDASSLLRVLPDAAPSHSSCKGWWTDSLAWSLESLPPPPHFVRLLGHEPQ